MVGTALSSRVGGWVADWGTFVGGMDFGPTRLNAVLWFVLATPMWDSCVHA